MTETQHLWNGCTDVEGGGLHEYHASCLPSHLMSSLAALDQRDEMGRNIITLEYPSTPGTPGLLGALQTRYPAPSNIPHDIPFPGTPVVRILFHGAMMECRRDEIPVQYLAVRLNSFRRESLYGCGYRLRSCIVHSPCSCIPSPGWLTTEMGTGIVKNSKPMYRWSMNGRSNGWTLWTTP
jgi:hypothetical protein